MAEDTQERETVSVEAHNRIKQERDQLKQQVQEAQQQLEASRKVSKVESYLRQQKIPEDQIPGRVDLLGPHLPSIPLDEVETALSDEKFAPLTAPGPAPTAATTDETTDPESGPQEAVESPPPPQGFGGPSPAGDDGKPPENKKLSRSDPEFQQALQRNDRDLIHKWYQEGRIAEPARNY